MNARPSSKIEGAEKESNEHLEALDFIKKERVSSARSMRLKQRHEQNKI